MRYAPVLAAVSLLLCQKPPDFAALTKHVPKNHFNPAPAYSTDNGIFGGKNYWSSDGCYLGSTYIDENGHPVFYDTAK